MGTLSCTDSNAHQAPVLHMLLLLQTTRLLHTNKPFIDMKSLAAFL
jgi:hypothetical protein